MSFSMVSERPGGDGSKLPVFEAAGGGDAGSGFDDATGVGETLRCEDARAVADAFGIAVGTARETGSSFAVPGCSRCN